MKLIRKLRANASLKTYEEQNLLICNENCWISSDENGQEWSRWNPHNELHCPFLTWHRLRHQIDSHQLDEVFEYLRWNNESSTECAECVRTIRRCCHTQFEELFDYLQFVWAPLNHWLVLHCVQWQRRHFDMKRLHVRWIQVDLALQQF